MKGKPVVHKELKGFEIKINPFGEIISSHKSEEMNTFLNKHVKDKKLDEDQLETWDPMADAKREKEQDEALEKELKKMKGKNK